MKRNNIYITAILSILILSSCATWKNHKLLATDKENLISCKTNFINFIQSDKQVFEIHAVGGNGKSHLLKYFSSIETEYIPLIFTKQVNIEEDLKKLSDSKKYLFIFDDIDRFLDTSILISLLSCIINFQYVISIGRKNQVKLSRF